MEKINQIVSRELLDSRGQPALEVEVHTEKGIKASALVPSGASTGRYEAHELRDEDAQRFFGKGLLKACQNVRVLSQKLKGEKLESLSDLDQKLIEWDGSENKNKLGANTLLGISLACMKALAKIQKKPLYSFFNPSYKLPIPLINVLNGGVHANNSLDVQEFMIVPHGFSSFREALRASAEVFQSLKCYLKSKNHSVAVGDEGGVAPSLDSNEEALKILLYSIEKAGYKVGEQISLALDVAASSFYKDGKYIWENKEISAKNLINIYEEWAKKYPLLSIEDGLDEEAWEDWKSWTQSQGEKLQIVGDDLFVTNVKRLQKGIDQKVANALLVKINQIGTMSEAYQAVQLAQNSNYKCVLSHRSGETEDTTIADLSLAFSCEQIKTGSVSRGERTAKYNRLLRIEEELGDRAEYQKWS